MKSLIAIFFLLISFSSQSMNWGVQVLDNKQKIKRFSPENKQAKIPLGKSLWNCYLSKTLETIEGFARSIDCRYGTTKAMISAKLYCEKAKVPLVSAPKSTTFAVAENQGEGFLIELRCRPND